ncbi:alpha-amylase family glycosyl hydrolase [Moheibacter lacus]|uniref:T9SS type A sorting domain-containing protein n=1 Tax=Moheibacter lacus TaxID=2745851 RepID=A0A838ZL14_9FLAO|nr:alpha-amylase family glycosyl hydrolase [Moheibacter lacus]MBA5629114.1 T9SS type A sorting domain-containing protein [Moheibacter lacus]
MNKLFYFIILLFGSVAFGQVTTVPNPPEADGQVILYFDKAGTGLAGYNGTIYAHMGVTVNGEAWQNVIGEWGDNGAQPALTHVSGTTYSLTMSPTLFAYFGAPESSNISAINVVFRSADGTQQTNPDYTIPVGGFQLIASNPTNGATVTVNQGQNLNITASTSLNANWSLKANGTIVNSSNNTSNYAFNYAINETINFELTATHSGGQSISIEFTAIVTPVVQSQAIPDWVDQGINYNQTTTRVTLALYAPGKSFVHVIGSFNDWTIQNNYLMKRDTTNPDLYWLEINDLTPGQIYTFQYRTSDGIKTADPFSTLVLSPWDDPYITPEMYPNLPEYPDGQEFEVSVLQTNQPEFDWQIENFNRPAKENLVVYELLIRDFNSEKTWNSLIDDFDYFKNLNVNAIEIMPVMEFEGNISWGYNTAYHMALDKAYGDKNAMKAFIDLCHQNGIAVILDLALNHVFGRSPLVRMWMDDPDGDGFGNPTAENPYLNTEARHAYNVGYDLNHQSFATQNYVRRTVEYWMEEFKIDGFRWDLTKGFTQNCSASDEECTNNYQADRVAILKQYADYQWAMDDDFYIIFEHLGYGGSHEEQIEWANYKFPEGKGIMLWNKATEPYNQNTMGWVENSSFSWIDHETQGYPGRRNVAYAESHDEERMMYKNSQWGNESGTYDVKDTETALERQQALGAILFTIPGPKMLWQFGELGYDFSINHCQDGTISDACRTDPKPIPSEIGYTTDENRLAVYNTWADIIQLRISQEVFNTTTYDIQSGDLLPRIYVWNDEIEPSELKNVVVVANFDVVEKDIIPYFPYTGIWYDLLTEETLNVTSTSENFTISLQPGEFHIYGNQLPEMGISDENPSQEKIQVYPTPTSGSFHLNKEVQSVEIYDMTGKKLKTFTGKFEKGKAFDIRELPVGIYVIKALHNFEIFTNKLIKR